MFQKVSRVFQKSFKSILSKIEGYFKGVFSGFHGHLKEFQREFHGSFKGISRLFQRSFKDIPKKFQRRFVEVSKKALVCFKKIWRKKSFKGVSRMFQLSFVWPICCCMDLIAAFLPITSFSNASSFILISSKLFKGSNSNFNFTDFFFVEWTTVYAEFAMAALIIKLWWYIVYFCLLKISSEISLCWNWRWGCPKKLYFLLLQTGG